MGGNRKGGPGRGRRPSRGKTLPAWPLLTVFAVSAPRRWLQNIHRKDHRGGRSSGRRGGFLSIRGHRHKCRSTLSGTSPRREWLQQKPLASAGRIYYVRCQYLQLFLALFYPIVPQFTSAVTAYPGRETFYYSWRLYQASLNAFSVNFP